MDISHFEKRIGVSFHNRDMLLEALTHRSYLNENRRWRLPHNERMEYLGDAVLELAVTEYLYRKYPKRQEGELTSFRSALVNYGMLSRVAREIGLQDYILLSRGEAKDTGRARDVILANAFEAVIGAIYLDQGYETAREFITNTVIVHLDEVIREKLFQDPKSYLQEVVQERERITPIYRVLEEHGPDHEKEFVVGVYFGEELKAKGRGPSKQEAERAAAAKALEGYARQ